MPIVGMVLIASVFAIYWRDFDLLFAPLVEREVAGVIRELNASCHKDSRWKNVEAIRPLSKWNAPVSSIEVRGFVRTEDHYQQLQKRLNELQGETFVELVVNVTVLPEGE